MGYGAQNQPQNQGFDGYKSSFGYIPPVSTLKPMNTGYGNTSLPQQNSFSTQNYGFNSTSGSNQQSNLQYTPPNFQSGSMNTNAYGFSQSNP
jgi:hypothetical protein